MAFSAATAAARLAPTSTSATARGSRASSSDERLVAARERPRTRLAPAGLNGKATSTRVSRAISSRASASVSACHARGHAPGATAPRARGSPRVPPADLPGARASTPSSRDVAARGARVPNPETIAQALGDTIPAALVQPAGLTFSQTMAYSACFAFGLMVLVGSLRPALVVLHNAWCAVSPARLRGVADGAVKRPFTDSFYGWIYKILRTALLMVALAWTYIVIVPISSEGVHALFPPEKCVRVLRILFYGYALNSFRQRYLARFAGRLRQKIYGKAEPADLIPAHVYDRETGVLVWSLTFLAALDSLGLPLQWVVKGLGASTVVLGILASVVLRDTVANYFGGLIVIAAGWFSPKEVVRVLLSGRREISGRVEHIGLLYTKLINRAGKVAYIPNSAMVAHKVENLSRAPYREFREQLAIPFKDLGYVPDIQERVEAFLRSTPGADVMRGVSLAPRATLTGINSFAGGAVLEVVCYNDYRVLRQEGFTTMRLRHHMFLGIAEIFQSLGVDFAIAGNGVNTQNGYQSVADNGLEGYDSTAQGPYGHKREDALIDQLDDRAAVGLYAKTPWL